MIEITIFIFKDITFYIKYFNYKLILYNQIPLIVN